MTSYRRALLADVPAIVDLAVEAVSQDGTFKALRVSRERIEQVTEAVIRDNRSYIHVAVDAAGAVQACVAAEVSDGFWFERKQATVLMFFTRKPGMGWPLLVHFSQWIKSRPVIKVCAFALEPGCDPRIPRMLARLGFTLSAPMLTYVRGT